MKIGVVSDTHGTLREEVIAHLAECEAIIHAGDIGKEEIISRLEAIAPLYVVRGNNDKEAWGQALPERLYEEIEGVNMLLLHDRKQMKKKENLEKVDLIICGHSHQYSHTEEDGIVYLNPGSCGRKRFGLPLSMAILEISKGEIRQITYVPIS